MSTLLPVIDALFFGGFTAGDVKAGTKTFEKTQVEKIIHFR
jgi:hypothetical protein